MLPINIPSNMLNVNSLSGLGVQNPLLNLFGGGLMQPRRGGEYRLLGKMPPPPPQPWWKQVWGYVQPYMPVVLSALFQYLQEGAEPIETRVKDDTGVTISIAPGKKVRWEKAGSVASPIVGAGIGAVLGGLLSQIERPAVQGKLSQEQLTRHFLFSVFTGGLTGAGIGMAHDLFRDLIGI